MKNLLRILLVGICAWSLGALADGEADMKVVGDAVGEMTTDEAMISAAVDSECGKYAPEDFRLTREVMKQKIEMVMESVPPDGRKWIQTQLSRSEFKEQIATFRKKGVEETLAMVKSKSHDPAFSCGYVFGFIANSILRFDHALARVAKELGK